ncbi:MAG: hypothetical protein IT179_22300 [Acidobacteria bacterium]|nr:hypothetical protein [Acidobacteriota bacterium]
MHIARVRAIAVLAASVAVGCGNSPTAAQAPAASPIQAPAQGGADPVVAEVGSRRITLSEVDAKWQEFDAAERARVTQLLYQNRRNLLDVMVGDLLIAEAAKTAGTTPDEYLEREMKRRAQPVSDAEVQRFYEENKERAQGRTLEQLRGPIVDFLQSQKQLQARAQLVDDLRGKAGNVRVLLDPPRVQPVVSPDDPVRGESTAPVTLVEYSDYQ